MENNDWLVAFENAHEALRAYSRIEVEALVRRVVYRLQRIHASGIYGDDYAYKTLWDEWCHEVQERPHDDQVDRAWDQTFYPILDDVIDRVPRHAAVLISAFAIWELEDNDNPISIGSLWIEGIREILKVRLREQASTRRLNHLGPWRNE
ncbi:hypothetical protein [Hwanghaeella sp. LZ110]|uniref:hypothetical protein n=1 Tax=Hwanghaeella sp. LZ110 TaxID=3402810 RepID=UPI003B67DFEF